MARQKPPKNQPELNPTEVQKLWTQGAQEILTLRRDAWLVEVFLRGRQWVQWSEQTNKIVPYPRTPNRAQPVVNRMVSAFESLISRSTDQVLEFDVVPTGADEVSVSGARIGESALYDTGSAQNWERIDEEFKRAIQKGGCAALCVDWDPHAGDYVDEETSTGDVTVSSLSITEFIVEPGSRDAENARYWIKSQILPPKAVQSMFSLPETPNSDSQGLSPFSPRLATSLIGIGPPPEGTLVLTYYERPNYLCPQGRYGVVVGNKWVYGPNPWPFPFKDRLNIAVGKDIDMEGRWYGTSVFSQAVPLQIALNATWATIIEHNRALGNARMIVPQSQMNVIEQLTDDPIHPIVILPNEPPPSYMSPPPLPQAAVEQIRMLEQEIDDLISVHGVSRGEVPGRMSGAALNSMLQVENTPVGKLMRTTSAAWGRTASMVLECFSKLVVAERKSVIFTPGQPASTVKWSGKDLAGQTRAVVPPDKRIPRNRAGMMAFAQTAMQMGLIPQGNFALYSKLADLPQGENMLWAVDADTARAQWNVHLMAEGIAATPRPYDDVMKHVSVVDNFRKTPKYDTLDPEIQQLLQHYVDACKALAAEAAGHNEALTSMSPALGAALMPGTSMGAPMPPPAPQTP